ncbi:choice-of-anchor L domain-containing protein [Mesoflavibacter profundi]|uniref:Choice-of-anchor L domain-containing protein n=3 Tax=Mesoflavibacter profundi TaxID=2708110 RepID=A0ABT4S2M3_9FLAO|nr:choice-of-anchor L domain-containing protein [Mesoflavibacter profundi]MDA0178041.1 choice-of-anchor L domain-containing protein [Mesoflavibacter profundi]
MKKTTLIILLFLGIIIQANSQTYVQESFDTSIPATWTITDAGGATGDSWASALQGGFNSLNGTNGALVDSDANGNGTLLIETLTTPVFDASAATNLFLDFDQYYNNIGADSAIIEVYDGTNWVEVLNQTADAGSFANPDQQHIDITAYANANMQVRFVYNDGDVWAWYWMIDNVIIYNSTCPNPTGLTVDSVTTNSVNLSWTLGGTESDWEVIVQPSGTGFPSGSGTPTTSNAPYTDNTLSPATSYEAYIRANCGNGDYSIWVGPVTFTTDNLPPPAPVGVTCSSGSSTFIFTEDFGNDTNYVPTGWTGTTFADSNGNWDITTPSSNSTGTGPDVTWDGNTGTHLEYEASGNTTNVASAITPAIDLSTAVDGAELSFYMHAFGSNMGTLNVGVSTSATGPFTTEYTWIGEYQTSATDPWVPVGINLDAYLGQVIYIEFSYVGTGDTWEGDMSIDQVRVETCGNFCVAPTGLSVDAFTDTTADISWTANNGETDWQIAVQLAGTGTPTSGTSISSNPYTATMLNPSTDYEVYVLADCGNGLSVWAGPINFTTANTPPPAPVGVTCSSGSSTFIFTEDFGNDTNYVPTGWTGTTFADSNGNWDITIPSSNSTGTGPDVTWDGNAGTHLEYEASGNTTNVASAITPAIDLSTAVDGAELSFYMHAYGVDMGTLNVGVSTSATGPFTTEYTWIGEYQTSASDPWVPIGINLDAYLGQVIYIEFSYVGTGATWEGDMSIDQVRVETCGNFCVAPSNITIAGITHDSADISWTPSGSESQWNYVVQPAGTGVPTSGTTVGTTTLTESGLSPLTDYEVYVQAICGANTSVWAGPISFSTTVQTNFVLDCTNGGPQTLNYCYVNNDTNVFTFTSSDGTTPLNITFNAGQVEQNWDELIVLDSDGITDLNAATPYGNNGDVSGITYQSTGSSISFQVQADGIFDCGSQGYTPLDVTVSCATCVYQVVDFNTVTNCSNGNSEFFIDVNITDAGDSNSLTISNDYPGSTPTVVMGTGTYQIGPFPLNTDVIVTVANTDDSNCIVTSSVLNVPVCPPANDECSNATIVTPNLDENCTNITNATLFGATASSQANTCFGTANDDVWFQFTASATDHGIDISNIIGDTINLNHALYVGTDCNSLTNLYCEAANSSIANGLTIGTTYYIRVYTDGNIAFQDVNFDLCVFTIPPPISVNTTQYTVPELVTDVLVNSPCAIVNNITWSTGTDFGQENGIGYFEANGSSFPFQEGIVMVTGDATEAPGPETGTQGSGGWAGDADLENQFPAIDPGTTNDATIIEFDFTPLINQMSFNFIFASEEYGTFQCGFSDAFAFLLTDLTTGITTNIALVPGTSDPVSVFTIRDNQYNGNCASVNPTLFDTYTDIFDYPNGIGSNPIANPINFRGRTVPLTASSTVTPNNPYRIKLVIADDNDSSFNSAVFLEASSFDIGTIDLGNDILISDGTATCEGNTVTLDLGIAPPTNATITWYTVDNGITEPIPGENAPSLDITTPGTYQVDITFDGVNAACFYSDEILVEFYPNPEIVVGDIPTIYECDVDNSGITTFDITQNEDDILGTQTDVTLEYFETEQDAIDQVSQISNLTTYTSAPTTIYIRLTDDITGCYTVDSFELDLAPKPVLGTPDSILGCDNDDDGIAEYDLTLNEDLIANGLTDLSFSYYLDETDAETSTNAITNPTIYQSAATTIYVRAETTEGCFETTMFELYFGIQPETTFGDVVYEVCPNATVPITVTAIPDNYTSSEVSVVWYDQYDTVISGATSLDLDTVLTAGVYTIEVTFTDTGCSNTAEVLVEELESCVIPQGISPGLKDGKNDTFDLSSFDVQRLEIYNRYGTLVYSKDNYINEWHGQSNNGDELPVGTYYYIMKYQGSKQKAAWIYINR